MGLRLAHLSLRPIFRIVRGPISQPAQRETCRNRYVGVTRMMRRIHYLAGVQPPLKELP